MCYDTLSQTKLFLWNYLLSIDFRPSLYCVETIFAAHFWIPPVTLRHNKLLLGSQNIVLLQTFYNSGEQRFAEMNLFLKNARNRTGYSLSRLALEKSFPCKAPTDFLWPKGWASHLYSFLLPPLQLTLALRISPLQCWIWHLSECLNVWKKRLLYASPASVLAKEMMLEDRQYYHKKLFYSKGARI